MTRPSIPELTHLLVMRYGVDHAGRCDCNICRSRRQQAAIDEMRAKFVVLPGGAK